MRDIVRSKLLNYPYHLREGLDFYLMIFEDCPVICIINPGLNSPLIKGMCPADQRLFLWEFEEETEKWRQENREFVVNYRRALLAGEYGR